MLKTVFTFCCILLLKLCAAQGTEISTQHYFGGSLADMGQFVQATNDGNLLVIGTVRSGDGSIQGQHGGSDIWAAKISRQGAILWQLTLGGSENDAAVAYTYNAATGTVAIVGNTNSNNGNVTVSRGLGDVWVCRISAAGTLDWQRTLGGSNADKALKIISTSDAGYLVCAETYSNNNDVTGNRGGADIWLVKLNNTGGITWRRCYGGTQNDLGEYASTTLLESSIGEYVFTANVGSADGDVSGYNGGPSDAWIVSVSNAGNGSNNWQQCIGGSGADMIRKLKRYITGDWLVLAQTASAGLPGYHPGPGGAANNFDVLRCRLAGNGILQYQYCLGSKYNETPLDIAILDDSTTLVLASVQGSGGNVASTFNKDEFSRDLWLCKMRNDTTILWQRTLGGSKDEQYGEWITDNVAAAGDMQLTPNNTAILMCMSRSDDGNVMRNHGYGSFYDYDIWVLAIDSSGKITSQKTIGGAGNEWLGMPLASVGGGSYYFTGSTQSINNNQFSTGTASDIMLCRIDGNNYITGKVFFDADSNGVQNAGEPLINGGFVAITKPGFSQNAVVQNGKYFMPLDTGIYQLNCVPPSGYYQAPPVRKDTMTDYFENDTINFALRKAASVKDVAVTIVPLTQLRPDSLTRYKLLYGNNGTDTAANGWVIVKKEPRMTLQQATPVVDSIAGDSLLWKYTNLLPTEWRQISLTLKAADTPTIAPWDTLQQWAAITPVAGDSRVIDNSDTIRQVADTGALVRIKTENHGKWMSLAQVSAGDYLTYTMSYTNTTGAAIDSLLVTDTLDVLADTASCITLYASHAYKPWVAQSRNLSWAFNGIGLLPGQTCTVSFRVKVYNTAAAGDIIKNKAYIWRNGTVPLATSAEVQTEIR